MRPISLTYQLAKVLEGFTLARVYRSSWYIDRAGPCLLQLALKALDRGNCYLFFFVFADFKKGFDLIDHLILMKKLSTLYNLDWSLIRWVASFLQGTAQVTRVGASVSAPLYLNGGIPQGTKLSPVLFAVMVNDLG